MTGNRRLPRIATWLSWSALIGYAAVLLTLTHLPKPPGVFEGQNDKTLHFMAYFVLGGLLYVTAALSAPKLNYLTLGILTLGIIFAAIDESTQPLFGRHSDLLDFRSDVIGLVCAIGPLAILRYVLTMRRRPKNEKQPTTLPESAGQSISNYDA